MKAIQKILEQGEYKKQLEIAKRMRDSGAKLEYIEKVTELTKQEIEKL